MLDSTDSRLLTLKDAARMLGTTSRYLWNQIRDGNGPPIIKIKKMIRIRREDFDNWLKAHERDRTGGRL